VLPRAGPDAPWPTRLWVVRHGESAGNVARDHAESRGLEQLGLDIRDVDVPLSGLGKEQARALGRWTARQCSDEQPTVVWTSPYVRARQTAELVLEAAGLDLPMIVDERLREREFGVLDGLTGCGIRSQFPSESQRRATIGKFYHRPPGGESWVDVALRLRLALDEIRVEARGERVLLVVHQVVVLLTRYVLERMDEEQVLAIDAEGDVAPCSLTCYAHEPGAGRMRLLRFNEATALDDDVAPGSDEADLPRALP